MVVKKRAGGLVTLACGVVLLMACGMSQAAQSYFPAPDAAVRALLAALESPGSEALKAVLGPDVEELGSGDPVADEIARSSFIKDAAQQNRVRMLGDDRAQLLVGPNDWPFSIPLVKEAAGWRFDTAAGKEELLNRRIGGNELHAIEIARAYVEAQQEYARLDPMNQGVVQYAPRFASSEGKRDGLYWPVAPGEPESPLGPLMAEASQQGYRTLADEPQPYFGYYYRILDAQGADAPGGARCYIQDGRMTGGFGLIAYPAAYGRSGIMTFIVNQRGIVYQRDLGADSGSIVSAITAYNPDPGWTPVVDD